MNRLTSKESKSTTLKWSGGFAKMNVDKPLEYVLIDKSPMTESPYVYDVSEDYDNTDEAWAVAFETDEYPETVVTHFPGRDGVKMSTADSPDYKEGKQRAMFGLAVLAIIRSGEDVMQEL